MISIFVRSLLFNVLFYLVFIVLMIVAIPTLLLPLHALFTVAGWWSRASIFLMRVVCGIRVEFRGVERIPKGPLIVASKHQSFWETFALLQFFDQPIFILKRELTWIPVFGLFLVKSRMIAINRKAGARAIVEMTRRTARVVRSGRQLVIFPEGTRRPPGAPPHYKRGVAQMYVECGVPCLPVALNSGLFWPRRTFMRYPGTLVVEFLDPLSPGLSRDEFLARLSAAIEDASNRLVEAGRAEQAQLFGGLESAVKA
jgi:1-acyl-sn-glycerol-3-phosphate acyltransferase